MNHDESDACGDDVESEAHRLNARMARNTAISPIVRNVIVRPRTKLSGRNSRRTRCLPSGTYTLRNAVLAICICTRRLSMYARHPSQATVETTTQPGFTIVTSIW